MTDKRKNTRRKDKGDEQKLSKVEDAIARHVRFTCPTKSTTVENEEVHYFTAAHAVDCLLESKWGAKAKKDPMFTDRRSAVMFMKSMLDKGLFWRARKLVPKRKERIEPSKEKEKTKGDGGSPKKKKDGKKEEKKEEKVEDDEVATTKEDEKKTKKKKVKLEMHIDQQFVDGTDVYVWIFDPTSFFKKCIVLGTVAACLFPLWPQWLRLGVYYLSMVGIGAFAVLLAVAILRTILFGIIWLATMGRHKLWILPNLTEDCGFFESFKPLYSYEYSSPEGKHKDKAAKKKKDGQDSEKKSIEGGVEDVQNDDEEDEPGTGNNSDSSSRNSDPDASGEPVHPVESNDLRKRTRKADSDDFVMLDDEQN